MATLKEKIGYALGDAAAGGITWKVMSIAFPLFFTNVFGLTVADTATLMLIARMFDVVTDPMMGALADRTQSRWGTYRPWLILGAVPFGLIFALLLYTPEFGPIGKRIWAYSLYLLMMVIYTAVNVPYGSLLGVMTDNDDEKNQFSSFRMVGAYAMGFITLLSFPYLQKIVGGTDQHQYAVLGAFFGIIAADIDCDNTGYYMISADEIDFDKNEVNKMVDELKRLMPNRDHFVPRRFVLGCCS